jgi:cystathionine beta-synthase
MADISKLCTSMDGILLPNAEPKCKWSIMSKQTPNPHRHAPLRYPPCMITYPTACCICREAKSHSAVLPNILEACGHTPLVRLDRIAASEGIDCELCKSTDNGVLCNDVITDSESIIPIVFILLYCCFFAL